MLVLSRKQEEKIVIGPPGPAQIVITVVCVQGDKVRLGIEAPKDLPVHREEVYEAAYPDQALRAGNYVASPKKNPGRTK